MHTKNTPTILMYRGAVYRLQIDPLERDVKRTTETVVLRELSTAAESGVPLKYTSWYIQRLAPRILFELKQEGYDQEDLAKVRRVVENYIIALVEKFQQALEDDMD